MSSEKNDWIRFIPAGEDAPAVEVLEMTDEEAHELRRFDFLQITTVERQVIYFVTRVGTVRTHYVLAEPATTSGCRERDEILARYGARLPVPVPVPEVLEVVL